MVDPNEPASIRGSHGFGIIGTGMVASRHAEAIDALPHAHLVAVTDVVHESATAFGRAWGCSVEPGLPALLARDDIDVVSVCVPSGLHAEVGILAAGAGKHLVVEKPIDVTLAAADRLIDAARVAGVAMTVISQNRFAPGVVAARQLLDQGALGDLVFGGASTKWYRSQAYYDSAEWRGTWELDGGSLLNQGIHYIDLLRWMMGPVAEVTAVFATRAHDVEVEDVTVATLRFSSGAIGSVVTSTAIFPGFAQRLEVCGSAGTLIVEDNQLVMRSLMTDTPDRGRRTAELAAGTAELSSSGDARIVSPGHAAQLADFLAAIDEGRQPAVTADSGRAALEIVCAIYQAARQGHAVAISTPDASDGGEVTR
jgi:predicted dehydrogenase